MSNNSNQREIVVVSNAEALAAKAAELIVSAAKSAIADRGRFTLVLSGGSTPERTYKLLSQPEWQAKIDWKHTRLFFGDERCVPHDDSRSNYHLANESLLKPAQIAADRVVAVRTNLATPAACAADYELQLKQFFGVSAEPPKFDLILLGLGDDGHTASLFPGKPSLNESNAWVTHTPPGVLPPPVDRVTLTFPVLNSARQAMFLVGGAGKATIVRDVLEQPCDVQKHPACGVRPKDGTITWLLDEAAASKLT
jgi:6-phosphogluconolactonase